ncbi:hypothetical protein ACSNOJ_15475 [Streptomyces sp. URMC 128]|uniref:hypothetical protein n=1 Tax=Streptomyces sp. URMC 128 TaxID=3423404 RepID=UPI003F1976D1
MTSGSTGGGSTGNLSWRHPAFFFPVIVGPVVAGLVIAGVTGAFTSVVDFFSRDDPGVITSGAREKPIVSERPEDSNSSSNEAPNLGGVSVYSDNGDLCSSDSWVYFRSLRDFRGSQALPYPDYSTAADADFTTAFITVEPKGDDAVQILGVRIKVIRRDLAPSRGKATFVEFDPQIACSMAPYEGLLARATLDGSGNVKNVISKEGYEGRLPKVLKKGDFFNAKITVSTENCSCAWVPVIEWMAAGERRATTLQNADGPFRTTPSKGLPRIRLIPSSNGDGWVANPQSSTG